MIGAPARRPAHRRAARRHRVPVRSAGGAHVSGDPVRDAGDAVRRRERLGQVDPARGARDRVAGDHASAAPRRPTTRRSRASAASPARLRAVVDPAQPPRLLPAGRGLLRLRQADGRAAVASSRPGSPRSTASTPTGRASPTTSRRTPVPQGARRRCEERYGAGLDARSHGESVPAPVPGAHGAGRPVPARRARGAAVARAPARVPRAGPRPRRRPARSWSSRRTRRSCSRRRTPTIWSFDRTPIEPVAYEALEHVTVTRDFLADPEAFLRHL